MSSSSEVSPVFHQMVTRSKAGVVKPNPQYALVSQKLLVSEPKTVKGSLTRKRLASGYEREKNKTWTLAPKKEGMNVIEVKWVSQQNTRQTTFWINLKLG